MFADLANSILAVADWITLHITMWILLGLGLFFTVVTRGVQVRLFAHMWRVVFSSRQGANGGVSSFQAFTISLAARVGIGNVFGVAAALLMGGPGALVWMWIVALIGMATSFMESTLAQIFKQDNGDGTFRGGPAYYMWLGLKARWLGAIFSIIAIITCGFVITSVQSNAIAQTVSFAGNVRPGVIAGLLFVFSAPVILGGIRSVARITEIMAPAMALVYVVLAAIILILHAGEIPGILLTVFRSAFSGEALGGGVGGGILAAIINGTKRGLFSNEAGQGTAPNAAATATVAHPVRQGAVQSLGVFVDTVIVCTATAVIIILAGPEVWGADDVNPATLTTRAVMAHLGDWSLIPMTVLIGILAFSSIIAAYVYSDVNMAFATSHPAGTWIVRVVSVFSVVLGALVALDVVWNAVDIAMAVMTITNLIALAALWKWGVGALRDYEAQRRGGSEPVFVGRDNPHLPGDVPGDVWARTR
ncbi:alanine:cation symporter family protein [Nanchangia anserum]|uniref:Alanine:cation symporter family protein n=1 Tax=Nanchangia anserum TaxID=2692125 RepID=A0A8I0GF56_9ACTO|nr:alanine/glycine:cation symporter family protein [Nanchangia anserum]MBD3688909.1 alanine:cation symporter family protein [Nanchangia anserum]QOX81174.1 alanine:cation symporter family protein [Nanchangia anserum]